MAVSSLTHRLTVRPIHRFFSLHLFVLAFFFFHVWANASTVCVLRCVCVCVFSTLYRCLRRTWLPLPMLQHTKECVHFLFVLPCLVHAIQMLRFALLRSRFFCRFFFVVVCFACTREWSRARQPPPLQKALNKFKRTTKIRFQFTSLRFYKFSVCFSLLFVFPRPGE